MKCEIRRQVDLLSDAHTHNYVSTQVCILFSHTESLSVSFYISYPDLLFINNCGRSQMMSFYLASRYSPEITYIHPVYSQMPRNYCIKVTTILLMSIFRFFLNITISLYYEMFAIHSCNMVKREKILQISNLLKLSNVERHHIDKLSRP